MGKVVGALAAIYLEIGYCTPLVGGVCSGGPGPRTWGSRRLLLPSGVLSPHAVGSFGGPRPISPCHLVNGGTLLVGGSAGVALCDPSVFSQGPLSWISSVFEH